MNTLDENAVRTLMSTIDHISTALDNDNNSWRDHLYAVRNVTGVLDLSDTSPDEDRRGWQLPLISVFQRVAFADADSGGVLDIANWCLKQAVTLLQVHSNDVDLLILIGRNWLLRAQKSLANIHHSEQSSNSSGGSPAFHLSSSEENRRMMRGNAEAESRLHTADYVEARGTLLPAVEYLKRAVEVAGTQEKVTGDLLSLAAEAYMSMGNVLSSRMNSQYFRQALDFLRAAHGLPDYILPIHLQNYLEDYGNLVEGLD